MSWFDKITGNTRVAQTTEPPPQGQPAGNQPVNPVDVNAPPPVPGSAGATSAQQMPGAQNQQPQAGQAQVAPPKSLPDLYKQNPEIQQLVDWFKKMNVANAHEKAAMEVLNTRMTQVNVPQEVRNMVYQEIGRNQ